MFFRRAQANDANSVVVGAFRENHHIKACINQPDGDKAGLSIIEAVIFAFERGVPLKVGRRPQRNAVLALIGNVFGLIKRDSHLIYVHPLNCKCKS